MKSPFLALLAQRPRHGYELKQSLEDLFGPLLSPINAGQVYTTLSRLERDGLVQGRPDEGGARRGKTVYELTPDGERALARWIAEATPVPPFRNDFLLKLVLARMSGIAEPRELIARQRRAHLQALREVDAAARAADPDALAAELLAEGATLHLRADLDWLDYCDRRIAEAA